MRNFRAFKGIVITKKQEIEPILKSILNHYRYLVGIDTGVNTGIAIWNRELKQLIKVESQFIHEAMQEIKTFVTLYPRKVFIRRKLKILNHGKESDNVSKTTYRYYGVSKETYYKWKRAYEAKGKTALINSKPCPQNPKLRIAAPIEEKIIYLRQNYYLGQQRISWHL